MDEWDSVRQKIKELENSILSDNPDVRSTLETVSVADFWKRRYEDEKQLWQEKLSVKETELSKIQEKFVQDEQGIRDLNTKLRELEERLQSEKVIWEERSKIKLLEAGLEKRKVEWEMRLRTLQDENEELKIKIKKGTESSEEETQRRQSLEKEKALMEEELKNLQFKIQSMTLEEQNKIREIGLERQSLQKELIEFQTKMKEDNEKTAKIEKELALLSEEQNRHLALLAEREKEQFNSFEDLVRGFTHRIRNHLGIMSGTLQLCLANFKMDDELQKQVTLVDQNAQELLKAIEEFLSLAKIPEMNTTPTDVNEFLSNILFTMEESVKSQNVTFEKSFSPTVPTVSIDAKLLSEAVKQLVSNAIEASFKESVVTINSNFESQSNKVVIRIIDTGKGIPESQLKKVFQPYFTTKKGKKGMGLTIAKRAVDLHHGSLSISSVKDQGTTVIIQLPVQEIRDQK